MTDNDINITTHTCGSVSVTLLQSGVEHSDCGLSLFHGLFADLNIPIVAGKDQDCVRGHKMAGSVFGSSANIVRVYARSQPSVR